MPRCCMRMAAFTSIPLAAGNASAASYSRPVTRATMRRPDRAAFRNCSARPPSDCRRSSLSESSPPSSACSGRPSWRCRLSAAWTPRSPRAPSQRDDVREVAHSAERGSHVTPTRARPRRVLARERPRTNGVTPLAETPMTTSLFGGVQASDRRAPSASSSSTPSFARCTAPFPPAMIAVRRRGSNAEGGRHLRGLEHAEPAAGAGPDEDQPAAVAHRFGDRCSALARDANLLMLHGGRTTRAIMTTITSSISPATMSIPRVAGLHASVGSRCHLDWCAIGRG